MKRVICFGLALLMLALTISVALCPLAVSAEDASSDAENSFSFDSLDFSCQLDVENDSIYVGGVIRHDVFVAHSNYTVQIYAIPPGADTQTVINDPSVEAVASSDIAIKFEFVLDAKDIQMRYSRYCVVLRSPDGEKILCTEPKFAEVATSFSSNAGDRSAYKGVATDKVSAASLAGAGRVIIPVYFDRLLSDTANGYVYSMDGENLFFDKPYIEELDKKIRSATAAGSQVYLQYFLLSEGENAMPDAYDIRFLSKLEAITLFLCERYENFRSGVFSGIIVGSRVDRWIPDDADGTLVTAYAEQYAHYVIAVANTARRIRSDMDIVLPFSEENSYNDGAVVDARSPSYFFERILSVLDRGFANRFVCTAMIESHTIPLTYPNGWVSGQEPLRAVAENGVLHAGNAEVYARYLDRLRTQFACVPDTFMFVWQASESLQGNALCAAYTYSYFRLLAEERISSLVVSFADCERAGRMNGFSDISHVFTYIDTADSESVAQKLLSYFAVDSWDAILCAPYDGPYAMRALYRTVPSMHVPDSAKGSFSYFDFSTSVNLNTWFAGEACRGIRLSYDTSGTKALQMDMSAVDGAYAEAFCLYEYSENLIYTPYVAFRACIEEKGAESSASLYEITIISGTGRTSVVSSASLQAGETETIVLDLSEYVSKSMSDYWRISVRPLDGTQGEYSLWIYDIVGYSTEYEQVTLEELIAAERLRIRNQEHANDDDDGNRETVLMVVGIVGVVAMIGIGVFILLRMNDEDEQVENEEENDE